ncbi:ribosomal protein S5 domain 2-like protein [Panus rudis PR-1116 ss-1]|nr:ribosomal protein S5 domain 2-like protein [Panus rudis PR-1116 ss-1]
MASFPTISKSEKAYIQSSLKATPPLRADGRSLYDFRTILLETGVAPLANGSARLNIGKSADEGGGGTEVLAATKLEVEDVQTGDGVDGGRIVCTVTCSPAAYPQLQSNALDDLQYDYTTVLHQTLSHPSLHPKNLGIIPKRKSWLLNLDVVILSDAGNAYDAMFMAARAALWDTKVPVTRPVQYKARNTTEPQNTENEQMDVEGQGVDSSGFSTKRLPSATDFELPDYWDEGEPLDGQDRWPVCITLNVHENVHFLDATSVEEASVPSKFLVAFSFPPSTSSRVQAIRTIGSGELQFTQIQQLIGDAEKYARQLYTALESKLREENVRRNQKARDKFAQRQ